MTHIYDADTLTPAQLAGQRLMVGFQGKVLDDELRFLIRDLHVGGLILFKRNIEDPSQLAALCRSAQACALESGHPPLTIAIDQEGGPVARLGPPFTVFAGHRAIGEARSESAAQEFGRITARELRGVGITMDFAPVLDLTPPGVESVMAGRVFGEESGLVAALGRIVIDALQQNGLAATAKHFPGIGRTVLDSHLDLPRLSVPRQVLDEADLVPFRAAIEADVAAVMLSHVVYEDLDPLWPASLSPAIAGNLLRDRLGFKGVSITDDLDMGAVDKHFDIETAVRQIMRADIDVALICHDQNKMQRAYEALTRVVTDSSEAGRRARKSMGRLLNLKRQYGPGL